MLKIGLSLAALLALCYMMADKAKIPDYSRRMNSWARPLAAVGLILAALVVLTIP